MGPGTGHGQLRVVVTRGRKADPERRGGDAADPQYVGVGEDDLAGDPVTIELALAEQVVPRGLVAAVAGLGEKLLTELLLRIVEVGGAQILHRRKAREELVVTTPENRVHVLAIVIGRGQAWQSGRRSDTCHVSLPTDVGGECLSMTLS